MRSVCIIFGDETCPAIYPISSFYAGLFFGVGIEGCNVHGIQNLELQLLIVTLVTLKKKKKQRKLKFISTSCAWSFNCYFSSVVVSGGGLVIGMPCIWVILPKAFCINWLKEDIF